MDLIPLEKKVSTVTITENKFSIDGIMAEMIIEVDNEVHLPSPSKTVAETHENVNKSEEDNKSTDVIEIDASVLHSQPTKTSSDDLEGDKSDNELEHDKEKDNDDSSKMTFARKLGLMCPKQEAIESEKTVDEDLAEQDVQNISQSSSSSGGTGKKKRRRRQKEFVRIGTKKKYTAKNKSNAKTEVDGIVAPGEGVKLGSIAGLSNRLQKIREQVIRPLYRVIYYSWPNKAVNESKQDLLEFSGFPFDEKSHEYVKRKRSLNMASESAVKNICYVLGMKSGNKSEMVNNIMKYLMKPTSKLDPCIDIALQPSVSVEMLNIDKEYATNFSGKKVTYHPLKSEKNSQNSTPVSNRVGRKRKLSSDIEKTPVDETAPKKHRRGRPPKENIESNSSVKKNNVQGVIKEEKQKAVRSNRIKEAKLRFMSDKKKVNVPESKPSPVKTVEKIIPDLKEKSPTKKKEGTKVTVPDLKEKSLTKKKESTKVTVPDLKERSLTKRREGTKITKMQRRSPDKRRKPDHYGDWIDNDEGDSSSDIQIMKSFIVTEVSSLVKAEDKTQMPDKKTAKEIDKEKPDKQASQVVKPDKQASQVVKNVTSDEETETDEEIPVTMPPPLKDSQKEKVPIAGKKLEFFPSIRRKVEAANDTVLQRLHVILYGVSNPQSVEIKQNILNFDGFKFEEGSDEWNQKNFLLSLVSMNYLREYVEILDLADCEDDKPPPVIINSLMKFLLTPQESLLLETARREVAKKKNTGSVVVKKGAPKKQIKKEKKPKGKPRPRKVLMSEEDVKKMQLEIDREERAKRRSSKQPGDFLGNIGTKIDTSHVSSVLDTIRKNKALLASGRVPSPQPIDSSCVKLGDNEHVKFMIVALNYPDLDILHNLIYLHDAVRGKIRRNILEFTGFNFDEMSVQYHCRETILRRLGINIVKRIAFIFGLTPLTTSLSLSDLIDLVLNFLISPGKTKQVQISEFPPNFFQDYPRNFRKEDAFRGLPEEVFQETSRILKSQTPLVKKAKATTYSKLDEHLKELSSDQSGKNIDRTEVITLDSPDVRPKAKVASTGKNQPQSLVADSKKVHNLPSASISKSTSNSVPDIVLPSTGHKVPMPMFKPNPSGSICYILQQSPMQSVLKKVSSSPSVVGTPQHQIQVPLQMKDIAQMSSAGNLIFYQVPQNSIVLPTMQDNKSATPLKLKTVPVPFTSSTTIGNTIKLQSVMPKQPGTIVQQTTKPKATGRAVKSFPSSSNPGIMKVMKIQREATGSSSSIPKSPIPNKPPHGFAFQSIEKACLSVSEEERRTKEKANAVDVSEQDLFANIRDIIHGCNSVGDISVKKISEKLVFRFPGLNVRSRQEFIKSSIKKVISGIAESS